MLLIPLTEVQRIIDAESYKQDTIDIWINFEENKIEMSYKNNSIDITRFRVAD